MKKINSLNETLLQILQTNNGKWLTNGAIREQLYQNSIGGLKLSDVDLRTLIKDLRFGGHPIIAGYSGYKYSNNPLEIKEYIANRKLELESELLILKAMERKVM